MIIELMQLVYQPREALSGKSLHRFEPGGNPFFAPLMAFTDLGIFSGEREQIATPSPENFSGHFQGVVYFSFDSSGFNYDELG